MVAAMGNSRCHNWRQQQWQHDPDGVDGGGAMDGRTAATAEWQLPCMAAEAKRAMAMETRVAGK